MRFRRSIGEMISSRSASRQRHEQVRGNRICELARSPRARRDHRVVVQVFDSLTYCSNSDTTRLIVVSASLLVSRASAAP